jgi:rsbT co-antagonist protein RsbR
MAAIDQTLEQREIRSQELASFYRWMLTVAIIFTALLWATYGALGLIAVRNTAIMASAFILAHAPIVALLRRRQTELAVFLTCIAMLLLGPIATLILPNLYGMQTMMPLIAAALAIQQLSQRLLRPILLLCWVTIGALPILGRALPADRSIDPLVLAVIEVGAFAVSALVMLLLWQYYTRLNQTVATLQATNDSLGQARATLASEVEARTADLQAALRDVQQRADAQARLLAEVEQQRTTIRDLTMPVIPIDEQTVVMPLVGSFDGQRLADVQEQALATIERLRTRVLILDITGVPVVDTHVAQGLVAVVSAARLLGAQTVLVGVRPEVAQSIVGLGLQLGDLQTERSLQMALLRRM